MLVLSRDPVADGRWLGRQLRAETYGRMAGAPLWFGELDDLRILSGAVHFRTS
jgi:hypothetical protein